MTEHNFDPRSADTDSRSDQVGSILDEAVKLVRAMASQPQPDGERDAAHVCTTTWCPVCQVAGFVRDNPEALAKVSASAAQLIGAIRELVDTTLAPRDQT